MRHGISAYDDAMREFADALLRFETTDGNEKPAQDWLAAELDDLGFETYTWTADAAALADHPSFPDDPAEIAVADRPSVGGVVEFGDPEAGPTVTLNGHVDVVPAERGSWSSDPFEPVRDGETLTARGAADMKCGLTACVFAAKHLAETAAERDLDGRVAVEAVVGEEAGGIGAAASAFSNPFPFERDAAIVAEPTELTPVVATQGSVMMRLTLEGRSAHAATRWRGESVLPHFEAIRRAFRELEAERAERVAHPLYEEYPIPWPTNIGVVDAGSWASSVPAALTAELRLGVAPGETVSDVEAEYRARLDEVVAESEWLSEHPPTFERFSVQFEAAETAPDEPIVGAVRGAMRDHGLDDVDPRGATYGADSRHYVEAGIPTVLFGPGSIDQAHFPDETVRWPEVLTAGAVIADATAAFLDR